jgi:hypothetical protein
MSVSQVRIGTSIRFRQVSEGRPPTDAQSFSDLLHRESTASKLPGARRCRLGRT